MSIRAHIIIEFGMTKVEFYRHWGGSLAITGYDLLQKLNDAADLKERPQFHDGGYVIRQMLSDSDGSLPQYQIIDGLFGESWEYGYHLEFIKNESSSEMDGVWMFRFAELEGHETSADWVKNAPPMTVGQFEEMVESATNQQIETGEITDLDLRDRFMRFIDPEKD
jgi:hypothetical protein